jgi:hypothetical protein
MKTKNIMVAGLLLSTLALGSTRVLAAENDQASSKATIGFTENNTPTDPKDPTDPKNPTDPTDPNQPTPTGQNGPLSLDVVPSFDFGTQKIDLAGAVYKAGTNNLQNYLQTTDNRTDKSGWTITVERSTFSDSTTGDTLDGTTLTIPAGVVRNAIPNAEQNNVNGSNGAVDSAKIMSPEVSLTDGQPVNILGTTEENANIGKSTTTSLLGETTDAQGALTLKPTTLKVPAGVAKAGNFESTLTWTTTAGVFK